MKRALALTAGLLLTALLFWWADPGELARQISAISPANLAILCCLQLVTIVLITWQWQLLAAQAGHQLPFSHILAIILRGSFVEAITPAVKAGGEAVKVILLNKVGLATSTALAVAAAQKIFSSLAFAILAGTSLTWFVLVTPVAPHLWTPLWSALALVLCAAVVAILLCRFPLMATKLPLLTRSKVLRLGADAFATAITRLTTTIPVTVAHFFLALTIWLLFAVKSWLIAQALGLPLGLGIMAAVTYLAYLAGMAPVPGGLGTFEATAVALLSVLAVPTAEAMALAVVLRLITYWFVFLLSGLFLLYTQVKALISPA